MVSGDRRAKGATGDPILMIFNGVSNNGSNIIPKCSRSLNVLDRWSYNDKTNAPGAITPS